MGPVCGRATPAASAPFEVARLCGPALSERP